MSEIIKRKAKELAEQCGFKTPQELADATKNDDTVPAMCVNGFCDYCRTLPRKFPCGTCPHCQASTVKTLDELMK